MKSRPPFERQLKRRKQRSEQVGVMVDSESDDDIDTGQSENDDEEDSDGEESDTSEKSTNSDSESGNHDR